MLYNSNMKQSKEINFAKNAIYNLAWAIFLTLVLAVCLVKIFDARLDEVLSDSMYPEITKKDIVVVVKQDSYEVGDIIEYKRSKDSINVTHRIIGLGEEENTFIPKGDASNAEDSFVHISQINGKVVLKWTNGRLVYNTIKNSYFVIITLLIGAWVLSSTISGEHEIKKHNILKI